MRELISLRRLLNEVVQKTQLVGEEKIEIKSTVFEDNNGVIATTNAVKMTPCTKHIAIKYYFFKSQLFREYVLLL